MKNNCKTNVINIQEVATKKEEKIFIDIPFRINKNEKNWIPPLRITIKDVFASTNPFWKQATFKRFLVYENNIPAARFALIHSHIYDEVHSEKTLFFGYIEFYNKKDVVKKIVDFIKEEKNKGNYKCVLGPINPSINYELGVLIDGFDKTPAIMMNYNQPYYNQLLVDAGATMEMNFYSYRLSVKDYNHDSRVQKMKTILCKKYKLEIADIDFSNFENECSLLCDIYNDAFSNHWGSLTMDKDEFIHSAKQMKIFMNKKLIFKLLLNDVVVGFILALPDLNEVLTHIKNGKLFPTGIFKLLYQRKNITNVKVLVAAIRKKYHHLGLGAILYQEMYERVKQEGYESGELSWVIENNIAMNKIIKEMNAKLEKKYCVYSL